MKHWKSKDLGIRALVRKPPEPGWNKLEKAWAQQLENYKKAGIIVFWRFEAVNLRLAEKTFYKPDFLVIRASGEVEFYEVKGHWRDDARVKIKVAASLYSFFIFTAVSKSTKKEGGVWKFENFKAHI
jgi:hypothetical protein